MIEELSKFLKKNIKSNYMLYRKVTLILYYFPNVRNDKARVKKLINFADKGRIDDITIILGKYETIPDWLSDCLFRGLFLVKPFFKHFGL
jgi:hypothetical protein